MISVVDIVERSSVGRLEQPFTTKENQMDAPPFEDDDYTAMAWPARIDHIQPGQKIAMWYGIPYNKWFVGPVTAVYPRRAMNDNVHPCLRAAQVRCWPPSRSTASRRLWSGRQMLKWICLTTMTTKQTRAGHRMPHCGCTCTCHV